MQRTTKRRTLRITRHRPDVGRDVDDEIAFHLEMRTQELIDGGMAPDEAARIARTAFGDREAFAAACRRETAQVAWRRRAADALGSFAGDLRLGLRQIARRPGLSLVVLATWALAIGANAGIFSLVRGILLEPLPYPEPDDLVTVVRGDSGDGASRLDASLADYVDLRDGAPAFAQVALYNQVSNGVGEPGQVSNVFSAHVTPSFFDALGVRPLRGRAFGPADGQAGAPPRVMIAHDLWQEHFGGAQDVVGRALTVDGEAHSVIGVLPEGFLFGDWEARLWLPVAVPEGAPRSQLQQIGGFGLVARLAPDASLAVAQAQVDAVDAAAMQSASAALRRLWQEGAYRSDVRRLHDDMVRAVRPSLLLLWAGVLFVLLIGCVNIATLLLVRNTSRLRELATRLALGAGRRRVIRQLVTESVVLACLGGALGLALGAWSLRLLDAFEAYEIPRIGAVELDIAVVAFTFALTTLVGLLAGLVPTLAVSSDDLHAALRGGGMPGAGGHRLEWLRGGLVAAQIAVAFVLLAGTGLLLSSLGQLRAVDPGFVTGRVLAGATVLPWDRYPTMPARNQAIRDMLDGLEDLPGVERAAVASQLPFSGVADQAVLEAEGAAAGETAAPFVTTVSSGYFATLGIPIAEGRGFTRDDSVASRPAVVVDDRLARRLWPTGPAVGRRLRFDGDERWFTVVGVAGSIVQNDLAADEANGAVYLPVRDTGLTFMRLALATRVEPRSVSASVRQSLVSMHPDARIFWVQTMDEAIDERLIFRRLPLYLMTGFAVVALLLSTLGVYGVLSHSVTARTRELGLRMALGGTARDLLVLTLRRGLVVVAAGLAVGVAGALALTRLLTSLLYQVRADDPRVFAAVAVLLAAVGLVACLVPARRATRVDPVPALKAD